MRRPLLETGLIWQHCIVIMMVDDTLELIVFRLWFDSESDSSTNKRK